MIEKGRVIPYFSYSNHYSQHWLSATKTTVYNTFSLQIKQTIIKPKTKNQYNFGENCQENKVNAKIHGLKTGFILIIGFHFIWCKTSP